MYQPELGRFLQPDPKEFAAGDYNLYRYCHNDPVNKSDPDGLVDLSYTPNNSNFSNERAWEPTYNPAGVYSIAGHGDSTGILRAANSVVPITTVVRDMLANGYKPGTPVVLIVCESGKGGQNSVAAKLAATLANTTGKTTSVHAPTTEIGAYRPGALPTLLPERKADSQTRTGDDRYDRSRPGQLLQFTADPDKKKK
jgi:uncharacterized protein RhaS with RHS repeats